MSNVLNAIGVLLRNIFKNFSNYCLGVGVGLILHFIKVKYGVDLFTLSVGIMLILISVVIELNKPKKR